MFGSRQQLRKCKTTSLTPEGNLIKMSNCVKYLGGNLDSMLNLKKHIGTVTGKAIANFFRIRSIRKYLNKEACQTLTLDLWISHLDYANAIMYGLLDVDINKLQRIQTICAKLVLNCKWMDSATQALKDLHCLPIQARISFKILTIVHKCLNGIAPKYLKDLLVRMPQPACNLRSSIDTTRLVVPKTKLKTFASRSFSISGPMLWNSLPVRIREIELYELFKKALKTHLFISHYGTE